nr:(+)-neomenthol dehydrogenase-like [Tanacetum cinerariifolium]
MHTQGFWRKYRNTLVNLVHPSFVITDFTSNTGELTSEEGAKSPVIVALLPDDGPSGVYFKQMRISSILIITIHGDRAISKATGALGEASGALGEASSGRGQSNITRFQADTKRGESSGGKGRARGKGGRTGMARGRGSRGRCRGGRGRGRGVTTMLVDEKEMNEEEIRKNIKHEYMEQFLIEEKEKRIAAEKAIREKFDEEAVRLTLEEEARYEKENQEKIREDEDSEYDQMWYNHSITPPKSASTRVECGTEYVQTQESIAQPSVAATETTPRGKTIEADAAKPPKLKQQGKKRKVPELSATKPPFRIYHKNRGRSKKIFNQKMKKTGFGPNGDGSTADKAFLF